MSTITLYLLALGWGLAGGFSHCIGMCGVFVVSYSGLPSADARRRFLHPERHLLFHGGRLGALTLLGLLAGALGTLTHVWAVVQGWVSLGAGLVTLGLALGFAGVLPRFRVPEPDILGAGSGRLRRVFVRVLQSRYSLKPLLIGIFVGFLPCGLTYQALIPALTLRPPQAALLLLLFGLGTVPGLLALGLFGNTLLGGLLTGPRFRTQMTRVAALFMGILGLAFCWRGLQSLGMS